MGSDRAAPSKISAKGLRLAALALLLGGLYLAGHQSGLLREVDAGWVREKVAALGVWGYPGFVALFALGELIHIPGMVFVVAGALAYGKVQGFFVSLAGALVSVTVSFVVVRAVGGRALAGLERPLVQKMLARLEARPISTVILLRTVLWLAPPLNYALALSTIRLRDYLLGSAAGLVLPVLLITWLFDLIVG